MMALFMSSFVERFAWNKKPVRSRRAKTAKVEMDVINQTDLDSELRDGRTAVGAKRAARAIDLRDAARVAASFLLFASCWNEDRERYRSAASGNASKL